MKIIITEILMEQDSYNNKVTIIIKMGYRSSKNQINKMAMEVVEDS
jgi:competence transcription factor ComK